MKILLFEHPRIESAAHYNDVANAPLSACLTNGYIASVLHEHGFAADIYDAYLSGTNFSTCLEYFRCADFDILGIHAVYFWEQTPELFAFLSEIRQLRPEALIVLYGLFPTFGFRQILEQFPFIDCIIAGEPERTFLDVAAAFMKQGRQGCRLLPGIAFAEDGKTALNAARPLINPLDGLPFPVRTDISLQTIGASILGSRGCCGSCSFCCINNFYGARACRRVRSPDNIAAEAALLINNYGRNSIYFLDADFFGRGSEGKARAVAIADRLRDFGITFGLEARASDIDPKTLGSLARAGLRDVFLGIESGSAPSLARMNKGGGAGGSSRAVEMLREKGIEPSIGFIMFECDAALEDVRRNFDFLRINGLLKRLHNTADVLYHREIVLRGMENFNRLHARGRLTGTDLFAYEGFYAFRDPAVQLLADLMATVARRVLRSRGCSRSPLYWKKGEERTAVRANEFLAALFESTLRQLELQSLAPREDERLRLEEEALGFIEGLIVEERICQA